MEPEGLKVGTLLIGLEGQCLHRSTTLAYCYRANYLLRNQNKMPVHCPPLPLG